MGNVCVFVPKRSRNERGENLIGVFFDPRSHLTCVFTAGVAPPWCAGPKLHLGSSRYCFLYVSVIQTKRDQSVILFPVWTIILIILIIIYFIDRLTRQSWKTPTDGHPCSGISLKSA